MIYFECNKLTRVRVSFIKYLLKWLKFDIYNKSNRRAIQARLDLLPYSSWIKWVDNKNKSINVNAFLRIVTECFFWKYAKNYLIIDFDKSRIFPGTNNTVDQIMRYVNYGNDAVNGTYFVSNVVHKYQKSIYDYFFAYRIRVQK